MPEPAAFDPRTISRPDPSLLNYYILCCAFLGPLFPIPFIPLYLKYHTLRYKFDDEGISMSWGILFRREIVLTYRRIQDIHLTRNLFQRWMGLATVSIQTASGNAGAEMTIEGILEAEALRDFLYGRMRGVREHAQPAGAQPQQHPSAPAAPGQSQPAPDEALILLREIRDSMARLAARQGGGS
jgi:membrane protein YdbS with pleckstrin-like domain